jgi:polysaccharide export outer membrane protein
LRNIFARQKHITLSCLLIGSLLASCASYKQNIMFKVPEGQALKNEIDKAEKNYTIRKNDVLQLTVYTNGGERLVDPEAVLSKDNPVTAPASPPTYLVGIDGRINFPMIREVMIEGLTIRQAENFLQQEYQKYYKDPFVTLKFANKRVVVLGAPGGQVIPLVDENVRLTEVLALAKGVHNDARANNIKVLRGEQLFLIDFSTYEGYVKNDMIIQPGDIVYVEPIRRPFSEGLRDYAMVISMVTSITTLIVVISNL